MAEVTIPPVAHRFFTACKKCGVERYHVVLAHTGPVSAKIECEVCHAKRTFKAGTPAKKRVASSGKPMRATRISVVNRWDEVKDKLKPEAKIPYDMKYKFGQDSTIEHPKFGLGLVVSVRGQSIEVVFSDATRSLVHNRQ